MWLPAPMPMPCADWAAGSGEWIGMEGEFAVGKIDRDAGVGLDGVGEETA